MVAILVVGVVACGLSTVLTWALVPVLVRLGVGQPIHEDRQEHAGKAGTPTMGGLAIVASVVLADVIGVIAFGMEASASSWAVLGLTTATAAIGFADDLAKVRSRRNRGLSGRVKLALLATVGAAFAGVLLAVQPGANPPIIRLGTVVRYGSPALVLTWIVVLVVSTSNSVNLTDGLDGLAAGSAALSFSAMAAMAVVIGGSPGPGLADGTPLAALAAAFAGATIGFLRWNAHPARIFMGDTGSLALGAGLAGLAAATGTGILLPLAGCLFLVEAGSVIVLVTAFRGFGRRPFHAPIHHQFQRVGVAEPTLVLRLWGVAAVGAGTAVALVHLAAPG